MCGAEPQHMGTFEPSALPSAAPPQRVSTNPVARNPVRPAALAVLSFQLYSCPVRRWSRSAVGESLLCTPHPQAAQGPCDLLVSLPGAAAALPPAPCRCSLACQRQPHERSRQPSSQFTQE